MVEIHHDDFSDPSSGWGYGYEDGRYAIHIDSYPYVFRAWKGIGKIDEGLLQVDVLGPFQENDAAKRGLGFGSRNGGSSGTYAFTINSSGVCEFLEYDDDIDYGGWKSRVKGKIADFDGQRGYYTLKIHITNYREATGYVDDKFCAKYVMQNYNIGYVGVVASYSYIGFDYQGGDSYFDEYRIFQKP
jgi:hypothetical protein